MRIPPLTLRTQITDQYWGITIQVSSSLHFSLQKAGQGEAMNFSNEKSKHFNACLLLCAHWGFWDNRGCCPCFHAWPSLRGSNSTWAPPWGLSAEVMRLHSWIVAPQSCLLQLSPSIPMLAALAAANGSRTKQPRRQRQQWWMAALVPAWPYPPGDPTGKHLGCQRGSSVRLCYLILPSARI